MSADAAWLTFASCIVCVGALVQGSIGFGLSLVAVPFLVMIDPAFVPGPLLMGGATLTLLMSVRDRAGLDLPGLGWSTGGRIVGSAVGAAALVVLPARELILGIGALVLVAVGLSVSGLHLRPTARVLLGAGVLSGFMGTTATIGGPPLALAYQDSVGDRLRGSLAGNLFVGAVVSLVAVIAVGRFGGAELRAACVLLPGVVIGYLVSGPARRLVDRGYTRPLVLAVSAAGAVSLILRELAQ
jgi:uncharacterized membrane protein YfcA